MTDTDRVAPSTPRCEVRPAENGLGVFATRAISAGERAIALPPAFDPSPSLHSIQIDERRHQAYTNDVDDFLNHACDPNGYVDVGRLCIVMRRAVDAGQEITINYEATEWDMATPFGCRCDGTPRQIRGFRHLSPSAQLALEDLVPAWLSARRQPR